MNFTGKVLSLFMMLFLGASALAVAQAKFTLREADRYYSHYHYASAIPLYELWIAGHPDDTDVLAKLADSYARINDARNGERIYASLVTKKADDKNAVFSYASMLAKNGKYEQSAQYFEKYKQMGGDDRAERFANAFTNIAKFYKDSANVKVRPLFINSPQDDFAPAFYKDGIVFCSDRVLQRGVKNTFDWNHSPYLDLYYVNDTSAIANEKLVVRNDPRKNKEIVSGVHSDHTFKSSNDTRTLGYYSKPLREDSINIKGVEIVALGKNINTKFHEGPSVFFKDDNQLVFTRNNYHKGKYGKDESGTNRLKLFFASETANDSWTVEEFQYNSDVYSVGHPAISPDEKILYFTSDMPGGKGGTDIWFCRRSGNGWSKPENLQKINTEGKEMFPFVDAQGNLFFASDGWAGLGGLDVFYSKKRGESFDVPRNVGAPINSMKDDFSLIIKSDGKTGYFSSARNWSKSLDDIYFFSAKTPLVKNYLLEGVAREESTNIVLSNASVKLVDDKGNEVASYLTPNNGSYQFTLEPESKYALIAEKDDYLSYTKAFDSNAMEPGEPLVMDAILPKKGVYSISCIISDSKTGATLDSVKFELVEDKSKSNIISSINFIKGAFNVPLQNVKKGDVYDLILHVQANGYLSKSVRYVATFQEPGELKLHEVLDLRMEKIDLGTDIGKLVKVNPIYFDLGKAVIRADAAAELDKIVSVMEANPGMKIELGSHTDARGSDASNLSLSDKRAKASAAYIVSKGISSDRIVGKGYGESKLVNACVNGVKCSEKEHQLNRRTEFIVTSF
jgi:outer membrane protein OmpA-like peptidoglycan-associated protein